MSEYERDSSSRRLDVRALHMEQHSQRPHMQHVLPGYNLNTLTPPSPPLSHCCSLAVVLAVLLAVRVSTKDAPVIWQWSTGHEWIPYDLDTTLALEAAYQHSQPSLPLTHGFFAANPGYSVAFRSGGASGERGRARHVQTNHNSGMRRQVRRIAEDDMELFKPVSDEERRQAERCSVCQLELIDNQDDTADEQGADDAVGGANHEEQNGEASEVISHATSKQEGEVRKSGSVAVPPLLQASHSDIAAVAAASTATEPPAVAASSSSSSSPDRVVRLAQCAPGHGPHLTHQCVRCDVLM